MDTLKATIIWALAVLGFICAVQYWAYTRDIYQRSVAIKYQAWHACVIHNYGHIPLTEPYPLCDPLMPASQ